MSHAALPPPSRSITATRSVHPGFGYAASCRSATPAGSGDLCEIIPLSETSLLLVMADVMGKGLSASLFAASLRTLTRAVVTASSDPAACLREINALMFEQLSENDLFITAQLVIADLEHRALLVGNAGHCPLLLSEGFEHVQPIAPQGIPLGIQPDALFESECVIFKPYSSVLLYTDGVTETRNPAGVLFGQDRLEQWFHRAITNHRSADALKRELMQELLEFQQGDITADDQAFLFLSDETPRRPILGQGSTSWILPWQYAGSTGQRPAL